jgi:enoyl-CoA hydratase/carnithine racemase
MGKVLFEQKGTVAWMTIDNQAKLNAVDAEMSAQIAEAYREIEDNPGIRVAVVTGAGEKAFSTGGEMGSYVAGGVVGSDGSGQPAGIPKPDTLSKPIIAAIRGYCIAGGFRIAATDARMGPSGLKRGVVPAAQQTERLVKLVPFGKALEILLLARYVEADEALAIGLVQKVVAPDQVVPTAAAWAEIIAGFSPTAVRQTKKLAYDAMPMPWADAFALGARVMEESFRTEDGREGFSAFLENRAPRFTGT